MRMHIFTWAVTGMLVFVLAAVSQPAGSPFGGEHEGLSGEDVCRFANSVPDLPGRIVALRLFRMHGVPFPGGIAVLLVGEEPGWNVLVFTRRSGQDFRLDWESGKLDDSFSVSSYDSLKTSYVGDETVVQFEGCAAHSCPDVSSILIYVPSNGTTFSVHHVWGRTTYSPGLEAPENRVYKDWLDTQIREFVGNGSEFYL